ncbi:hypothetical protein SAMN05216456_1771 [Devosia crocina]|uniref:Uncharacterized protein n=1 Tax=Devosia crocina TaxID=429728 RepID=A0A1I7NDM1_9HYPH|nr:hypothetical protein [Devosia crocina]SFV32785.1 hypothetical protein SAMN05216456_1771 [Devosia crocina]
MAQTHNRGTLIPQETNFDNADQAGIAQPYSQSEIEDLLYGDDRSSEERLARLREMRDELAMRESGDWGDEDPAAMINEIDRAIEELSGDAENSDDNYELADVMVDDPANHSHALSPDDVDALRELSGEASDDDEDGFYEEDEDGPADDDHWSGSEEFRKDIH